MNGWRIQSAEAAGKRKGLFPRFLDAAGKIGDRRLRVAMKTVADAVGKAGNEPRAAFGYPFPTA